MWKDYSIGFIKKNRASSVSVLVAAFISALFLSLLCGLFYNFWNYEIESVVLEEGNWQGRISGAFEEDKVSEIENFANVKTAIINEDLSDDQTLVVDICFDNMRAVYQDMPLIAQQLGVPETSVSYHESLLSSYFINLSFRRIIPTGKIYRVLLSTTFKKCQKYKESCSFLM